MRDSREFQPDNETEAWLQEFDRQEIDAQDARSMWALKYRGRLSSTLRVLRDLPPGARVLEVGASQANASLLAAEAGLVAVALDRNTQPLRYAFRKHSRGEFSAVCADALALPFAARTFAAVVATEILEHLPEPVLALTEIRRVLAPGGLLIVTTPNVRYLSEQLPSYAQRPADAQALPEADASGHLFAFTLEELRALLGECGLEVQQARYEGSVVMSDKLVLKRLLPVGLLHRLSGLLTRLPGGARLAYSCLAVGRRPLDST